MKEREGGGSDLAPGVGVHASSEVQRKKLILHTGMQKEDYRSIAGGERRGCLTGGVPGKKERIFVGLGKSLIGVRMT